MMSGYSWEHHTTGVFASGCGSATGSSGVLSSTVTFLATGSATGHSSGNFKFALRSREEGGYGYGESGPEFLVHMDGLGHVFTGFKSTHSGEYKAINRSDHFNFRGVSGIKTVIKGRTLDIGGPRFTASGCLTLTTETSTNKVTYGIDKPALISCLGYEESKVRMLIATGEYPDGPAQGPITSFSGEDGTPYFNLCDFTILRRCPQEGDALLSGCCTDPEGACCDNGNCIQSTESECPGYFWGVGTNCGDQPGNGTDAPYYAYTYSELCRKGIGCVYNDDYAPGAGTSIIGYECYDGPFGGPQCTMKEYLDHVASDSKFRPDQFEGTLEPSIFKVGETCATSTCPTTTSTTTTTTSTTSSTTTMPMI